ncbi:Ribonuclease BN [Symmachiella macrocystis]|uniref:Ribonuclease BN n=1 Tax=Symmachiella macrocystis TaxID=2527985 RepID=A0A5C6BBS3_9PLAN|nr:guanitoxin biosynthesis MBL fold metallo-hydrolase GntH [Symmachiella macrocystis]TWU09438.1 Ribonuclease BN [Symmachiella macrocystis]
MSKETKKQLGILSILAIGFFLGFIVANNNWKYEPKALAADANSTEKYSPVKARGRDFYTPNSETLQPNEMRLLACGTGMPTARPKQAASCWLLELGNGDKFIFDVGTGSAERISAFQIPYNYLDKVFLSHLHTDHFGDLDALFVGGALAGRQKPLRVWGPSGGTPERGTKYAVDHLRKALTWDLDGRKGITDPRGYHIEVNEFDYRGMNKIVYQENGVTIRSFPAIHALDGPVSYSLEWNGLKFVFGGDTYPNKWFAKYAKDADLAIHECFIAVPDMITKFKFTPQSALAVGTQIHTAPEAFGSVMSLIKPRMAVAYHFFKDFDTTASINDRIRKTYKGPLSLSMDYMVWNITPDEIRVRMAVVDEDVWPPPATEKPQLPDASQRIPYSKEIVNGKLDVQDVIQPTYDEINKKYGLKEKQD